MTKSFAAIEEFIDAKIAFAKMEPERRRIYADSLQHKRNKAIAAWNTRTSIPSEEDEK